MDEALPFLYFNLTSNDRFMKYLLLSCAFYFSVLSAGAQEDQIRATIDRMFNAMYKGDTAALRQCFIPAAQLVTYTYDAKGNPRAKAEKLQDFMRGVATMGESEIEEKLIGWQCLTDDGIASVWTPYEFYFEGKFNHCGVNSFQLIKIQGDWKITQITDTRRSTDCPGDSNRIMAIDSMINQWHHAAAVADEETFFGSMTADGIYIGTDATERWLRDDLAGWSKKYFDGKAAWNFTPLSRNIRMAPGGQLAWFDELLDTWMGTCRSTGIVVWQENAWKIIHYHLSVAVPNEKIDAYKALIGKD